MSRKKAGAFIISISLLCCISIMYTKKLNYSDNADKTYIEVDTNEWALYNFGQEIEDSKGIEGVDINWIKALDIYNKGNSQTVIVGVIDTGIYSSGVFLNNKIWINKKESIDEQDNDMNGCIDDYFGWDFYNNDNTIYDNYAYDYHGTYIANAISQVAPDVQIIACKFMKGTRGSIKNAIEGIKYAIDNGARIINCSWCFEDSNSELEKIIKENRDVLFVCAAGNSCTDLDKSNSYPASYKFDNVISVMAIDNTGQVYEFSGYGMNVDVAAPGKDILVRVAEDDETYVDGTSISTAYVTAAATMLMSYNQNLTSVQVKEILIDSCKKCENLKGKLLSEGYIDIYNALLECENYK